MVAISSLISRRDDPLPIVKLVCNLGSAVALDEIFGGCGNDINEDTETGVNQGERSRTEDEVNEENT